MESVLQQYFSSVRPMHEEYVDPGRLKADLVLDHECSVGEGVRRIEKALVEDGAKGEAA